MKRLFLIHGLPRSGKSTLAKQLRDEASFALLSLDELYVQFIQTKYPALYFEALPKFIGQHYQRILQPIEYSRQHFERDLVNEWHEYLRAATSERLVQHNNLVVEGFLLYDCSDELEAHFSPVARVVIIVAHKYRYRVLSAPVTVKEIAVLGQSDEQTARKQEGAEIA